ncbi:hypothetical protein GCM10027168_39470 [Streptomyces capparidis]
MCGAVLAGGLAGGLAAAAAARAAFRAAGRAAGQEDADRWLVVTVEGPPEAVMPGRTPPEPLAALGDRVEVRVRPAPGGRGTELAARPRVPVPTGAAGVAARLGGDDPRQAVRSALRDAKSLLETGEVIEPAPPGTDRETPGGKIVGLAARRAGGEGVL